MGKARLNAAERQAFRRQGLAVGEEVDSLTSLCSGYTWYGVATGRGAKNGDASCSFAYQVGFRGAVDVRYGRIQKFVLHGNGRIYAIIRHCRKTGRAFSDYLRMEDCPKALKPCFRLPDCLYGLQFVGVDMQWQELIVVSAQRLLTSCLFVPSVDSRTFAVSLEKRHQHD